jgi:ketosteroid isomerase-like protein
LQKAKAFIDSANINFSQQLQDCDSVALASNYWPDAELLMSNSKPIKSKDIISASGATIRMGINDMTFTTTNITGDVNFIIETGNYEMRDGGESLIDRGKYVVVWKQINGEWKLYRDIGNTSLPASE